jgi:hypothetical protein
VEADAVTVEVTELGDITHSVGELRYFLEELGSGGLSALEDGVQFAIAVEVDDSAIGGRASFDFGVVRDSQCPGGGSFVATGKDCEAREAGVSGQLCRENCLVK